MDLDEELRAHFLLYNNSPLDDFCGLSPVQMQRLLYHVFAGQSPVALRKDISNATLNKVGFFRLAESYLQVLDREKETKLTATGALPPRIVKELYGKGFVEDYAIGKGITKLSKEADCLSIQVMRFSMEILGAVKKRKNILSLTKRGRDFLQPVSRLSFFKDFLHTNAQRFSWNYFDSYTELPIGQMGWAFTVFLLLKYGQVERDTRFYAEKYKKAYPFLFNDMMEDPNVSNGSWFESCYSHRSFGCFFQWFSLCRTSDVFGNAGEGHRGIAMPTDLLFQVFELDE